MLPFLKNFNLGLLDIFAAKDGYVALDIGSSSVKMIEAAVDRNGYRILSLGILPLPEYLGWPDGDPALAHRTTDLFEHSPFFAEQLIRNPELLSELKS